MIESRISIKHDCRISIFQERMKAGKQESKIEIKQSFNISRLQYGKND